jgi:hypothetical protein
MWRQAAPGVLSSTPAWEVNSVPVAVEPAWLQTQRRIALEKAKHVRRARAELKRQIACGQRDVAEILLEPPTEAQTMTVGQLLGCQRSWGKVRTRKALQSAQLSEHRELRGLTLRQVQVLLGTLRPRD